MQNKLLIYININVNTLFTLIRKRIYLILIFHGHDFIIFQFKACVQGLCSRLFVTDFALFVQFKTDLCL